MVFEHPRFGFSFLIPYLGLGNGQATLPPVCLENLFEYNSVDWSPFLEALCMRWTYTPVVGSTPVLGFLPWSWGHPFRGSVTVQINRQEQTCPSLAKGWALPQAMNGMFCNRDPACCRLYRLFSTLVPVVGFTTCSQLCRLFSAFTPVLDFQAFP